ncbi:MAG: gliding motility-associated C-terminal domain-containing protein, partial [Bacteroidota bacterium]
LLGSNGCDSTVNLNLTVLQPITASQQLTLCAGESYKGTVYNTNTTLTENLTSAQGCDSILTTTLIVNPTYAEAVVIPVCENEAYDGIYYSRDTILVDSLVTITGCDSIISRQVVVYPTAETNVPVSICYGAAFNGTNYFADTLLIDSLATTIGCDSVVRYQLTVNEELLTNLVETICEGDVYTVGSSDYTATGTYTDVLSATNGCDSTVTLDLTVLQPTLATQNISLCEGDYYDGTQYTTNATLLDTLVNYQGCDSILTTEISIRPVSRTTLAAAICIGDSLFLGGEYQTSSGRYLDTLTAENGCDSVITTLLVVNICPDTLYASMTICEGDSALLGGIQQTASGTYLDTYSGQYGQDSTVVTDLTVLSNDTSYLETAICQGDSIFLGGAYQQMPGTYTEVYDAANGCDSLVVTTLQVLLPYTSTVSANICEGESYFVAGAPQTTTGIYRDTMYTGGVCANILITYLTVTPLQRDTQSVMICQGETFYAGGELQSQTGIYRDTTVDSGSCMAIRVTILNVMPVEAYTQNLTICEGDDIFVGGGRQTTSGTYIDVFTNRFGCDSTVTTQLEVVDEFRMFQQEVICEGDSILINGVWEFDSGEYEDTYTSVAGCDSIVVTELIVESIADIFVEDQRICLGDEVELFVEGSRDVSWSPAEGLSCIDCPNPMASPFQTTTYTVTATSCLGRSVQTEVTVYVSDPPEVVYITESGTVETGDSVQLVIQTNDPNAAYTWSVQGETICDSCNTLRVKPLQTTTYQVDIENEYGCKVADEVTLRVNNSCAYTALKVPNIISPNGDGYNDRFNITYEGIVDVSILRIYNRWGQLVYETNDITKQWDGTFRGKTLNPGVYVYYLEGTCLDNEAFTLIGNITVLR